MQKIWLFIFILAFVGCKKEKSAAPVKTCQDEMAAIDPVYLYALNLDIQESRYDLDHPGNNSVKIIPFKADLFFNLLDAVRKLNIPTTDSIFNLKIAFQVPEIMQLVTIIIEDSTKAFNDSAFLNLIKKYNLEFYYYSALRAPNGDLILKSCPMINIYALSKEFNKIGYYLDVAYRYVPEFKEPQMNFERTDAYFSVNTNTKTTKVTFFVGIGDCQSGCIKRHTWEFEVDSNFKAKFISSSGNLFK